MGKSKATGKNYVSKGERPSVSRDTLKGMKRDRSEGDKLMNKLNAWMKGKNPWITFEKPAQKNQPLRERFYRVKANDVWGDPRKARYGVPTEVSEVSS